jgi:ribosome-binding factor A
MRVNEVVRETLADELERLSDPRLEMVTITGVEVARDLRTANVYFAALDHPVDEVLAALAAAAPHLRAALGHQVRMKYLPRLEFHPDRGIEQGERVEAIIREIHRREEEAGVGATDDAPLDGALGDPADEPGGRGGVR